MPPARPHLSLVAPAHNEAPCVGDFVMEARAALAALGLRYEIICVDDGSTDGTRALLQGLKARVPELRVLVLETRQGQSAALAAGIQAALGEVIALMDADLQNHPGDLAGLLRILDGQPNVQAVAGRRERRCDSWLRRAASRLANGVAAWILDEPTRDGGCGTKLFRAEVLKRMRPFRGMHRLLVPLARLDGAVVAEAPVRHRPRLRGVSKYGSGLARTPIALCDALGVRWMRSRQLAPRWKEP